MQHSEQLDQIGPALVRAQQALRPVEKSAENSHFRNKYAPLEEILAEAHRVLHPEGLYLSQSTIDEDDHGLVMVTTILHGASGQWIAGRMRVLLEKPTPQGSGSAATYSRRFGLVALLGMRVGDPDDDGNEAETHSRPARAQRDAVNQTHTAPPEAFAPDTVRRSVGLPAKAPATPGVTKLDNVDRLYNTKPSMFGGFLQKPLSEWDARQLSDAHQFFQSGADDPNKEKYKDGNQRNADKLVAELERRSFQSEPEALLDDDEPPPWAE